MNLASAFQPFDSLLKCRIDVAIELSSHEESWQYFASDGVSYAYVAAETFHLSITGDKRKTISIVEEYTFVQIYGYFSFANAFLNNTISVAQLERAMVLGKLGEQVVLMSEKAFDAIQFTGSIAAPKERYLPKKLARDTAAREDFQKEKGRGSLLTEKYILDIMREGWKNDDQRLQRVVLG